MEWILTIVLSVAAIFVTIRCDGMAIKRLEEIGGVISEMDKKVTALETVEQKLRHIVKVFGVKHK
jgi:hypothetical protein